MPLDRVHGASAEAASGHSSAVDPPLYAGDFDAEVELGGGYLVVVLERAVRGQHEAAEFRQVVGLERANGFEGSRILGDHVSAAAAYRLGQIAAVLVEVRNRDVAQRAYVGQR